MKLVCQGPLKRGLRDPKGPLGAHKLCICKSLRIIGMLYISKLILIMGKLIETHHIMRFVCHTHRAPHALFGGQGPLESLFNC